MRKPVLSAAALFLATTALAACGGIDKNAYVDSVTKVQQTTQREANALSEKMNSAKTPDEVGTNLAALGETVEKSAADLAAIEPPEDVADQHKQYVDLMKKFGTDLEGLATRVKDANADNVQGILTDATKLTSSLSSDETKIVSDINAELQG